MNKIKLTWLLIILIALLGCSKESVSSIDNIQVEVIVSENFGNRIIDKKTIKIDSDLTVMDIMLDNFEVETVYGGSFINAIGNLESGFTNKNKKKKYDWFYYVNGISAEVGADEYYLDEGDQIVWDYHNWESGSGLNSIISAYPSNFDAVTTEILYTYEFLDESEKLSKYLGDCHIALLNEESLENTQVSSIVIAKDSELRDIEFIENIYNNARKVGLYYEIDNSIKALDYKGNTVEEYEKAAVIVSIAKSYGEEAILWLITGNDREQISKAIDILIEKPDKVEGAFSVLVTNEEIIKLPIQVIGED
jgi:hypothetical protein